MTSIDLEMTSIDLKKTSTDLKVFSKDKNDKLVSEKKENKKNSSGCDPKDDSPSNGRDLIEQDFPSS